MWGTISDRQVASLGLRLVCIRPELLIVRSVSFVEERGSMVSRDGVIESTFRM